jgi:isocitrate lyase
MTLSALLTLSGATLAQTEATRLAPKKGWLNDLNAARAQAQKSGKPLMVVFRCDP